MNPDSLYIGAFGGILSCLFVLTLVLARILRSPAMLLIDVAIVGFGCFFLADRTALSHSFGLSEARTWSIVGVAPLFIALISISFILNYVTKMKGSAMHPYRILMFGVMLTSLAILFFVSPTPLQKFGPPGLDRMVEGLLVPQGFAVVIGFTLLVWAVALIFTPILLGEWRAFSIAGLMLIGGFLVAYSLVLYNVIPFNEGLSNELRLALLAAIGCLMLAMYRRAAFANLQRDHFDSSTRGKLKQHNDKQVSHQAISQAHFMQVLKHEKELEDELRKREAEQMEALRIAKDASDEMARSKASFLAFMSHEIRTPLNGIMGMVRLLMNTDVSDQQRDYIQTLNYSGDALLSLVNDTLDISKIEAGQLVLESIDFDLQRLISSIIMLMSARASEKSLLMRSDIGQNVPKFIRGDPTRLRQILLNLINNAIKFTEEGGITVRVRVVEGAPDGSTRLRIEIQDTGPGISEEGRARLFKEYSQVDASTTRLHGGTGLGLSICKQLVQAMAGDIGVDSELGKGSSFWFIVTFLDSEGDALGEMQSKAPGTPSLAAMVIEDNEIHQKVIGGYLRLDGHKTTLVGSAEEALDMLAQHDYDVLLMDVNLPGIDGNEATRRIRKMGNPTKSSVPIIAITGNTSAMDIDECRQAGMNDFVGKPVDPDALRTTVLSTYKLWLEQRKLPGTSAEKKPREGQALHVLVVDDNDINQRVIAGFLKAGGHQISTATSGEKAVLMAATAEYDLILMDVTLPGIDGLEASRRIRALPDGKARSVPIAAITGNTSDQDRQACLDAGMNDFLGKPIDPDGLAVVVDHVLNPAVDDFSDYLPQETPENELLDEVILGRLSKAFNLKALSGLMDDMIAESRPIVTRMAAAVKQEAMPTLRAEAHMLKGMAMTLGVAAVGELAADIETSVQRGVSIGTLSDMVDRLEDVFDNSCKAIDRWREKNVA